MPVIHVMPPVVAFGVPTGGVLSHCHCVFAGLGIDGSQIAGEIVEVAGDADDDVIAHDQRRHGRPVALVSTSATTTFQRTVPSLALSEIRWASGVMK